MGKLQLFLTSIQYVFVLLLSILFCPFSCQAVASENISLQLAWKHQFQFAGYYAALHKGYYRDAGLNVKILEGGKGLFAREQVKSGAAQYGVAGTELLLHRADGDPFVVLAPIFQHSPSILLAREDSQITNLQDLIGKRVMLLPGKKDADILAAFLNEGIPLDSFTRLDQTYNLDDLINGHTDTVSAYITNEPYEMQQRGVEPKVISPQTYGVDFYSDCLFTSEEEIVGHPQRAKAFLQASLQGWEYAMENTEEIIDLLLTQYGVKKSRAHLRYEANSIRQIMLPEFVQIGHMNPGRWRHIADTYASLKMIEPDFPLEGFLYRQELGVDHDVVWRFFSIAFAITIAAGLAALILLYFNRRLAAEINERKRIEQALKLSDFQHKEAQRVAHIGHWELDPTINRPSWSEEIFQIFGLDPQMGEPFFEDFANYLHPEDWPLLEKAVKLALSEGTPFELSFRLPQPDGQNKWMHAICTTSLNKDGNVTKIFGTAQDITVQKMAEKEILAQKQRAEQYLNLAGVIFMGFDRHGRVNLANHKACHVLGYERNELLGMDWIDKCIPANLQAEIITVFAQLMKGDVAPAEYHENPVLTKNGTQKIIQWHNAVIRGDNGKITGILSSGEDITEKLLLESQLRHAQKMESIGNLAGGIAHDFNNILSSIIGYTELALDEAKAGTALADDLQEVLVAGKRARDLVKQILAFARQSDENLTPLQPAKLAREVVKLIRSTIPTTIEVRLSIESDSLIMGNTTQIHQMLLNMCTNAAQAMEKKGGILEVSLRDVSSQAKELDPSLALPPGSYLQIAVADTGPGIPTDLIDSIFDPYFTTKGVGEGTGMGLAVVHGIVEGHGGKVSVKSETGDGTVFTVYLPLSKKRRESFNRYSEEVLPLGTERLLLVDDEAPIAKMSGKLLKSLGYNVSTRTSSVEALELFRSKPNDFDLVITDMTMPNMTGEELAKKIVGLQPGIPVILCTGYSKNIVGENILPPGIAAFAYKPLLKADLAKMVRKLLDERHTSLVVNSTPHVTN